MSEYLTLGPTPADETCYPNTGDRKMQQIENRAYVQQLDRILDEKYGEANVVVSIRIKSFPHDMGSYYEVCVSYDPDNAKEVEQAFWLESNCPSNWDGQAEQYLRDNNYVPWSNDPEPFEMKPLVPDASPGSSEDSSDDSSDPSSDEDTSSICEDEDQPTEYCESCHVCGHGPATCPSRFWINQPKGKRIEAETTQHLLPGEVLNLVLPVGGQLQIEHTADSYSINIEDVVLFNAERYDGKWEITWPGHMVTDNDLSATSPDSSDDDQDEDENHPGWVDDQDL